MSECIHGQETQNGIILCLSCEDNRLREICKKQDEEIAALEQKVADYEELRQQLKHFQDKGFILQGELIQSQAREMRLREFIKGIEWKEGSDISDIHKIKPYWFCETCNWHRENGHDPRCSSPIRKILNEPAPPITEVLDRVENYIKDALMNLEYTMRGAGLRIKLKSALAALQSLRGKS